MTVEKLSFCRICMGHCGVRVRVDDAGHLIDVRGDHEDGQTLGYACFKGLRAAEAHNSPDRVLYPLKRGPDGRFQRIGLEQALDEIAARVRAVVDMGGAEAVAGYKGGGAFFTASASMMLNEWLKALGSPKVFSSVTIDQSAKVVCAGRIGVWPAGRDPFHRGDVFMIVGGNPLLSLTTAGFDTRNPAKRLKEAKARGMKLIIIDPRYTETARFADVFLQPLPGEDPVVLAGLLHIIFAEGWEDRDFCNRYVGDLERLHAAVAPFTPERVATRADVPAAKLYQAAEVFAHQCHRGAASSATGPDMSPDSNLAEHLVECLNVVCGRFVREGEPVDNPGVIGPRWPRKAEVMPAARWWEQGYRSRIGGYGLIDGELPTGIMADEILEPGTGQVKCLFVHGGNPASSVPDQQRIVEALKSLELLVAIEPFMTATAELADYILPSKLQYERPDLPLFIYENLIYPEPFTRYTPAVAVPPEGSELVDDGYVYWALAKRLGISLEHFGAALDMTSPPDVDDLLAIAARHSPVSFETIKAAPRGVIVDEPRQYVEPGDPGSPHRFTVMPDDVAADLAAVAARLDLPPTATGDDRTFSHRLAVRRLRDVFNSVYRELPSIRQRMPHNRAYLNPADLAAAGIVSGEAMTIESESGNIVAIAQADATVRPGVVSIAHGFGTLPGSDDYATQGVSTNRLIDGRRDRQAINAMPRMSGIPVNIRSAADPAARGDS